MKRADKEHLKRVITVLLIASMLLGSSQVPQMPQVKVVAWAYDDTDLLNADMDDSTLIGDTTEEDLLQPDISGGVPEEDVMQPDTAGSPDTGIEVSYIDADGVSKTCDSAIALSESEESLTPGWYVVSEDIVFQHSVILNGQGEYHIILADGKTMQIGESSGSRINDGVGLGCAYDDSSKDGIKLHIYAQSSGNSAGKLNIYDSTDSSFGRSENEAVGDAINVDELTINGGKLNLDVTGSRSYGINSKKLTINGGDITADATVNFDEGNPGGWAIHSAGDFTINDGSVNAQSGGSDGYAVLVGDNGSFTMNNGELTAVAKADGIGLRAGEDIIINGGKVNVESNMGDGIKANGNIAINGGQVTAKGAQGDYVGGIRISDSGSLSLSWNKTTDFIDASSFKIAGSVTIPLGKAFKDGNGKYYVWANSNTIKGLTNVKLLATADIVHTVSFNCGGYEPVPDMQLVMDGSRATAPTDPKSESTLDGKSFAGWYQDTGYQIPFDFNSAVTSDLYLYAKWATLDHNIENADVKQIYRHTGSAVQPVVKNNVGETLTKDTHYTITGIEYEKTHSGVNEMKEPGFYNLTITGKSPYSGSKSVRVCVLTFGKYDPSTGVLNNNATLPENTDAAVVTASTVSMNSGWYVVTRDVNVNTRMKVQGDVHLVLCDGATLNAAGNDGSMGISVTYGNSLTIYSQAGNTGKLLAASNGVNYYAGIGGDAPQDNKYPYLGQNKNAGNITIHGGEIYAKGSYGSAAIGMAYGGQGGNITIYGGKITARSFSGTGTGTDTGIGGQNADIHLFWSRPDDDFIISDGYQGSLTFDKPFIIEGTSTLAKPDNTAQYSGKKIEPIESFETHTVTFDSNGGTEVETQTVANKKKAVKPVTPIRQGYRFAGWFKDTGLSQEYYFDTKVTEALTLYAKWNAVSAIAYIGEGGNVSNFTAYSPMEADYEVLPTGSYYVGNNIELLNRIRVNGIVSLILKDNTTLNVANGISVMGRENTLNIFGQSGGTGILEAKAVSNNAAIGGDDGDDGGQQLSGSVGNINIYGGDIRVQGGIAAASIGGGNFNEYYGDICIYGGTISGIDSGAALGGVYSAAIGGGFAGNPKNGKKVDGTVRILGGEVTVSSPQNDTRTGIGGGQYSYGGTIDILGGKVEVTGAQPGIGDGQGYGGEKKARITLGCKNQDDWINSAYYNGKVRIAPNQTLKIENTSDTFKGDISDPTRIINKKLVLGHSHSFTYAVNGTTITATCQNDGCDLPEKTATLTLSAPNAEDLVYDGTGKPAIVIDEHNISGDEVVHYQKKNGNNWIDAGTAAPKDVGTYCAGITLTDAQTQSSSTVSVEYTITKRNVTIAGLVANSRIYDGTTTASVNDTAMVLEGKIEGDAVSIVPGNAKFDSADAGENKTVTFTGYSLTGSAAGNYSLVSQPASVTADIEKRPATVKALDQTVQFGNEILQDKVTCEGLADGQVFTSVKLTPDPDPRTYSSPKDDGTIMPSGAVIKKGNTDVTGNYEISYVGGNLTITLPKAKITKHPTVRTNLKYEGYLNEQALVNPGEAETRMEYKVQKIANGHGHPIDFEDYMYPIAPDDGYGNDYTEWESGSYRVWYRAASDNTHIPSEPEYVLVGIAQIPLTVKVEDETIPYGEKFKLSMNVVQDGFHDSWDPGAIGNPIWYYQIDGRWINVYDAGVKDTRPDLGAYPVKVQYEGDNYVRDCYKIDSIPGFLYVVPRTVGLNWGNTSFTFNGQPQVPTVALTNLSNNEVAGAVGAAVSGAQVNAGTYTAAAVALSGEKASKYALPADNTVEFSIAKADYSDAIPHINLNVPVSAVSYNVSVAGKMPRDAGELHYTMGTISSSGPEATSFNAVVDEDGLVTVTKGAGTSLNNGDTIYVDVDVDSTNYNRKTITTEATFVNKSDAGVSITQGTSLSANYSESPIPLTLNATVSDSGINDTWTWDSSDTNVATATGSNGNCTVTIKGVGTAAITAKYDSDTTTGYATLILTVNPISVPVPAAKTGLSYNGYQQTGVESGTHYTLTGEKGTLPGIYVAAAALTDTENHRWSDGTIEMKSIPWTIEKQAGPAAPTGLKGVTPTTWANIDGKITGVNTQMEYSTDAAFTKAFPCTDSEIIGLKDGTYYVRYKETEYVKAGAAAEVVIPTVAPPIVRAIEGLVYNGSPQVLVTADTVSEGKIYYAVTGRNDPEPDKGQYSTTLPAKTNAGSYRVWYEIRGAGDPPEKGALYVELAQKDLCKDLYYINLSANGIYGTEGMVDISSRVPEGERPRLQVYASYVYKAIKGAPTIDNPKAGADTMRLHYSVKKEEDCYPVPSDTVRFELFSVSVDRMVNYHDYNVEVKIEFYKECPTNHRHTVPVNNSMFPDRGEKDYTGYVWCQDCHGIFKGSGGGGGGTGDTGYALTVINGTGTGSYKAGSSVEIRADEPEEGKHFKEWEGADDLIFTTGSKTTANAVFTMPEREVSLKAIYEEGDHIHEYTSVVTQEPTCTDKGIKTFTCDCGDSYTEEIPALGHDYEGEITKDPTTEADGEKTFTCKRCGHSYTEAIPKLSDSLLLYEKVESGYEIRVSRKLVAGKGFTLVPKFASGKVVNERVVWESANPDVATVTQEGRVKAISGGETTVLVRSEEDPELTAYCIVTVTEPVTEIILDKSRVSFGSGEKTALTAEVLPYTAQQKLVFSTANASTVILCDENGDELPGTGNGKQKTYKATGRKTVYVKAVNVGNAKVTAAAVDGSGKKCSCAFSVGNPVPEFSIHGKGKATEVKAGKTLAMQIEWEGAKPKNPDVTWYVLSADGKDPAYTASVSDKGVLTGITAGKVKVLAVSKANPERTAEAEIAVTAPEKGRTPEITEIRLTNSDEIRNRGLNIGKSYTLNPLLTTSGTGKAGSDAVAWISSDSKVATVSQKGVVKAVAPGKVTITAVSVYAADTGTSPKDSVTFSVYAPVKKVKLDKTKLTVGTQTGSNYGKIAIAALTPAEATNPAIMWTADNDNVQLAAVLKDGSPAEGSFDASGGSVITEAGFSLAVKAIAPGVTKLTGVTMDGSEKKLTCKVTVRGEVTGVKLISDAIRMKAGSGMTLKPILDINGISGSSTDKTDINRYKTYKKYTDTSVSYRSSDTSVLTVNKKGKIKVNKDASGKSAIVYAASADGRYVAKMTVTVD